MTPHELIGRLIASTNKSTLQVAIDMGGRTFQGTLHKYVAGDVLSPKRSTAKRIADYFKIDIEAIYDVKAATRIAAERGLLDGYSPTQITALAAKEPPPREPEKLVGASLSLDIVKRIATLDHHQLQLLEVMIVAHLDAVAPLQHQGKQRRA